MALTYKKAGVDIEAADRLVSKIATLVRPTLNSKVKKSIGGYAALYDVGGGKFIAATTDGVGTKLKLAFQLGIHDTVGIDLVAMSANDLVCVGASPLFFLDYFATGKLRRGVAEKVLAGIVEGCKQADLALIGGETAEMPGMYAPGEYDLAGFAVGMVDRAEILGGSKVKASDWLIGVESSGPHSNGFSLIRRLLKKTADDRALTRACFTPTKMYVKTVKSLQAVLGKNLHGLAHITGSGFLNIPRLNEKLDYKIHLPGQLGVPSLFRELRERSQMSWSQAYTTFNMGIGLVAAVDRKVDPDKLVAKLRKNGVLAHWIGKTAPKRSRESRVEVQGPDFGFSLQ